MFLLSYVYIKYIIILNFLSLFNQSVDPIIKYIRSALVKFVVNMAMQLFFYNSANIALFN